MSIFVGVSGFPRLISLPEASFLTSKNMMAIRWHGLRSDGPVHLAGELNVAV